MTPGRKLLALGLLCAAPVVAEGGELGAGLASAQERLRAGNTATALVELRALAEEFPGDPAVGALLGRALVSNRDFAAAEPFLVAAVGAGGGDFGTRLTLAAVLWENGRLAAAEDQYRQAAELSNRDPAALYPLAKLLLWRGDAATAAALLTEVRQARPGWTEVSLDLARALEQCDRLPEALAAIEAFVATAPEHAEALYTLATVERRMGRGEAAAATLERFVAAQAEDRERTLVEGRQRVALDEVRAALEAADGERALSLLSALPAGIDSLRLAARAYEILGRSADALRALERAVAEDPSRADVRVELQEAYRRLGQTE